MQAKIEKEIADERLRKEKWDLVAAMGTVVIGTENFRNGALNHILEGETNACGNTVGFHYEGMPTQKGKIISGTEILQNSNGVYQAMIEAGGNVKTGNGGFSTFFPKDMTPQQIVDTINQAFANKSLVPGTMNTYTGTTSNGITVTMYIDKSGNIISAFPNY